MTVSTGARNCSAINNPDLVRSCIARERASARATRWIRKHYDGRDAVGTPVASHHAVLSDASRPTTPHPSAALAQCPACHVTLVKRAHTVFADTVVHLWHCPTCGTLWNFPSFISNWPAKSERR